MEVKMNTSHAPQEPKITFGKGVRVGNFRLYKVRKAVGNKETIEAIVVSSFSQAWSMTIPSTFSIYNLIEEAYASYVKGNEQGLIVLLSNFYNSTISLPYYQGLLHSIYLIYTNPNLEVEKDGNKFKLYDAVANDVRWIGERIATEYEQDRIGEEEHPDEEALKRDETYHEMIDELKSIEEKDAKDGAKSE